MKKNTILKLLDVSKKEFYIMVKAIDCQAEVVKDSAEELCYH